MGCSEYIFEDTLYSHKRTLKWHERTKLNIRFILRKRSFCSIEHFFATTKCSIELIYLFRQTNLIFYFDPFISFQSQSKIWLRPWQSISLLFVAKIYKVISHWNAEIWIENEWQFLKVSVPSKVTLSGNIFMFTWAWPWWQSCYLETEFGRMLYYLYLSNG